MKQKAPDFLDPVVQKRFMLIWDREKKDLKLEEFEREDAIASLDRGVSIIPVWLDEIHHQLAIKLDKPTVN